MTFFKKRYNVNIRIEFNWLDDFTLLIKLPSKDIVEKVIQDWVEVVTSEDSAGSSFRKNCFNECE